MNNIKYLKDLQTKLSQLYIDITKNYYEASISGDDTLFEASSKAQFEYEKVLADKGTYQKLKDLATTEETTSDIDRRTAKVLLNESEAKQINEPDLKKMIDLQTEIEKKFTSFRAEIDDRNYTDNEIENTLSDSNDSKVVEAFWKSSKEIGNQVSSEVLELVHLRNASAKELGYDNYHSMQLQLNEIDPTWLENIFDELDELTRPAFEEMKTEIDSFIAKKFGVESNDLKPWHYGNRYFQEAPAIYDSGLDTVYKEAPIHDITKAFYDSIGLNIDEMSSNSDLYEKEGKNQHAFCIDIDREIGDIRILCNIVPSHRWMDTDLHEFGHGVYDYYMNRELPWALMTPSHIFTTEAIAMLFGRLAGNAEWIRNNVPNAEKYNDNGHSHKEAAMAQIVFSRWAQVMYRFEKDMYADPKQDLQKIWWDLVSKYQGITMPIGRDSENDWASKIHIATVPCYYHNYLLGEIMASQLQAYITKNISNDKNPGNWKGDKKVGEYLTEKVFKPGKSLRWDQLVENATGENLTAKYYSEHFCDF
jgi:peptidyl-dipeptidase A